MSDYIDRDKALAETWRNPSYTDPMNVLTEIRDRLRALPAADVVERKTGKWIKISPAGIYECTKCGGNIMTGDIECYRFCHQCGAKMEVEHE